MVNETCPWERKALLKIYRFRHFKLQFRGEAEGEREEASQAIFLICLWHMENCWKFPTVVEKKGRKKHLTTTKAEKETQPLPSPCISEPHAPKGEVFYGYFFWNYSVGFNLGHSSHHLNSRKTAIATHVTIMIFFSFIVTPFLFDCGFYSNWICCKNGTHAQKTLCDSAVLLN